MDAIGGRSQQQSQGQREWAQIDQSLHRALTPDQGSSSSPAMATMSMCPEVAGGVAGPSAAAGARRIGLDAEQALALSASHRFFEAAGDQIATRPEPANVDDVRAILMVAGMS
ncbi:MAG: hypothetical protein H6895_11260 [Defluviimonas sp.]|uniref:hypothetical protein n=1 Tax=Albidovulum sp. TaxID=1872424 RepID=UPI002A2FBBCC|nr:hypothetical protein [Defluviimonas sp.]